MAGLSSALFASIAVAATTTTPSPSAALQPPPFVSAFAIGPTEIDLIWGPAIDQAPAPSGYRVYRDGKPIGTTSHLSFADTGLTPGKRYTYTVRAVGDGHRDSRPSIPATASTLGGS